MKSSHFNTIRKIGTNTIVLFNTLNQKYILVRNDNYNNLINVVNVPYNNYNDNPIKKTIYNQCIKSNMIIDDDINEFDIIKYARYKENEFKLTIYYNYSEHNLNLKFKLKLKDLIKKISDKYKIIHVILTIPNDSKYHHKIYDIINFIEKICINNNVSFKIGLQIEESISDKLQNEICALKLNYITLRLNNFDGTMVEPISKQINSLFKKASHNLKLKITIALNDDNIADTYNLLNSIDYKFRKNIILHHYNCCKSVPELTLYEIYLAGIHLGYEFINLVKYLDLDCSYGQNSLCINNNLDVSFCYISARYGDYYGSLDENLNLNIHNYSQFMKYPDIFSERNYRCTQCVELPMCTSNCPYYRSMYKSSCCKNTYNDLTLEHKIILRIASDALVNRIPIEII